jgi:hypothetical protein
MTDINQKLQSLFGNPVFNMGVGLLAAGGQRPGPRVSFGQGMAEASQYANSAQAAHNQLQQQRNLLGQKKLYQEIGGLLSPQMSKGPVVGPIGPPAVDTPEGQSKLIGLLGQVAPDATANALLNRALSSSRQPTLSRDLNDFMYLSQNPEMMGAYQQYRQSNQDPTEARREQLLTLQVQQALQELSQGRESQAQQRANTQLSTIRDLENLKKLAERNNALRGTFLESGLPARGLARSALGTVQGIQDAFGVDSSAARRVNSDFDDFDKLASNLTLDSLARYSSLGALNSSELQQVIRANAQLGASPETNAMIVADNIRTIVRSANAAGVEIPDADEWLEYASSLEGERSPQGSSQGGNNTAPMVIDLNEMD